MTDNVVTLRPVDSTHWNLRVLEIKNADGSLTFCIAEVYYENDKPKSYCPYFPPQIDEDELPATYTKLDVAAYLSKAFLEHLTHVNAAVSSEIISEDYFKEG